MFHMDITRWPTPGSDWLCFWQSKMVKYTTVSKNKTESWLCSYHELHIDKFRLKLKKVGKTTRSFSYYLIKSLRIIQWQWEIDSGDYFGYTEWPMNYGWKFVIIYRRQGVRPSQRKTNTTKANWLSEETLQIVLKRRKVNSKGEKERYTHLNVEFQRIARKDKKAILSDHCKEIEEDNRTGKTRDLLKKIRIA